MRTTLAGWLAKGSRWSSLLVPLMLLTVLGCGVESEDPAQGDLVVYRGTLTTRMLLTGELAAEKAERLVVPNANIWPVQIRWLAEDGTEVQEGDRLVEFDNSQLTANLDDMRGQVIEAANQLSSLRAQAASEESSVQFELEQRRAAVEKARITATVPASVIGQLKYQKRQLDLEKAELELAEAEAKLTSTRSAKDSEIEVQRLTLERTRGRLQRSEARIDFLTLRASRDGILILDDHWQEARPLQPGDSVFPGWAVGRLPDLSTLYVSAQLFDVDDGQIEAGMPVTATLDAFPEQQFAGRVREIGRVADQVSSRSARRRFETKIDLEQLDVQRMRPGMSVKVVIEQHIEDALLVPRRCLAWGDDGPAVRLADGAWQQLVLGACDAQACVVESGIEEAVRLALASRGRDQEGRG